MIKRLYFLLLLCFVLAFGVDAIAQPSTQAGCLTWYSISQRYVIAEWASNGNGDARLVVIRTSPFPGTGLPQNGTVYTDGSNPSTGGTFCSADPSISGASVWQGSTVLYNSREDGSSTRRFIGVGDLQPGTQYYIGVFEYNWNGGSPLYNVTQTNNCNPYWVCTYPEPVTLRPAIYLTHNSFVARWEHLPAGTYDSYRIKLYSGSATGTYNFIYEYNALSTENTMLIQDGGYNSINPDTQYFYQVAGLKCYNVAAFPDFSSPNNYHYVRTLPLPNNQMVDGPNPLCLGNNGVYNFNSTAGAINYNTLIKTYDWGASGIPQTVDPAVPCDYTFSWINWANPSNLGVQTVFTDFTDVWDNTGSVSKAVTVITVPTFVSHPLNQSVCTEHNATFAVNIYSGVTPAYQWQMSPDGSTYQDLTEGQNYVGVTTSKLTVSRVIQGWNNYRFRAVITNTCGSVNSNPAILTVPFLSPSFSDDPDNLSVCGDTPPSGTATFRGVAFGTGILTYQWQFSSSSGASWLDVYDGVSFATNWAGATTTQLVVDPVSKVATTMNNYLFRLRAANECNTKYSEQALLTINYTPTITLDKLSSTICANIDLTSFNTTTFFQGTVIGGGPYTYQWVFSSDGGSHFYNVTNNGYYSGATTTKILITGSFINNGYLFRLDATNACGTGESSWATLTVNAPPTVSDALPSTVSACYLGSTQFTAAVAVVNNAATTYRWEYSSNGGGIWQNVNNGGYYSGATTTKLYMTHITMDMNGYQYRLYAQTECGFDISTPSTLTVCGPPEYTGQFASTVVCDGDDAYFGVTVTECGSVNTFLWQYRVSASDPWVDITNGSWVGEAQAADQDTELLQLQNITPAANGIGIRVITSNACGSSISNVGTLTIHTAPSIDPDPPNMVPTATCEGNSFVITAAQAATVTGDFGYSWYCTPIGGTTFEITDEGGHYSGITTSQLTIYAVTPDMDSYEYQVAITSLTGCGDVTSDANTITVWSQPDVCNVADRDTWICNGDVTSFDATVYCSLPDTYYSRLPITYQWQFSATGLPGSWGSVVDGASYAGATTSKLYITADPTLDSYRYRLQATNDCASELTDEFNLFVHITPTIATQPFSASVCENGEHTFYANISFGNEDPSLYTYLWYLSDDDGNTWEGMTDCSGTDYYSGCTTSALRVYDIDIAMDGDMFRYEIGGPC